MTNIENDAKVRRAVLDAVELRMAHGHADGLREATRRFCNGFDTKDHARWVAAASMMIELGHEDHAESMAIIRDERSRIFGSEVSR